MDGVAAPIGTEVSGCAYERKESPTVKGVLTPPVQDLPQGSQPTLVEPASSAPATAEPKPVVSNPSSQVAASLAQPTAAFPRPLEKGHDGNLGVIATPESLTSTSPNLPISGKPAGPSPAKKPAVRERWFERRAWPHVCGLSDRFSVDGQIGQGTFGSVLKAKDRIDKQTVAIKKFQYDRDNEGIPITAIREMKLLQKLNHPNIIKPKTICMDNVDQNGMEPTGEISMVFPFMHYDLAGIIDEFKAGSNRFSSAQKKSLAKQLITGVHYLHKNHVIHRDLKGANVLLSNKGEIKIADFGLARPFNPEIHGRLTSTVVTRWYRPPELVLNDREYNEKIDMWGIGCMLAELYTGQVLFPGETDESQLNSIIKLCGPMNYDNFPRLYQLPERTRLVGIHATPRSLRQHLGRFTSDKFAIDLIDKLLTYDPKKRLSAVDALNHKYFWSAPYPCAPKETIPIHLQNSEVHEMSRKKRKMEEEERHRQKDAALYEQPAFYSQQPKRHCPMPPPGYQQPPSNGYGHAGPSQHHGQGNYGQPAHGSHYLSQHRLHGNGPKPSYHQNNRHDPYSRPNSGHHQGPHNASRPPYPPQHGSHHGPAGGYRHQNHGGPSHGHHQGGHHNNHHNNGHRGGPHQGAHHSQGPVHSHPHPARPSSHEQAHYGHSQYYR